MLLSKSIIKLVAGAVFALSGVFPFHHPVPVLYCASINVENIRQTSNQDDVMRILGEAPFVREDKLGVTFSYPIRIPEDAPVHFVVPAAILRVTLDAFGLVADWCFLNPISEAHLEIMESLYQADSWYKSLCNPPARIELNKVLCKGTPRADVIDAMRWFKDCQPIETIMESNLMKVLTTDGLETLIFFADRPSPLYIPPFYYEVTFYSVGERKTGKTIQGWGGCK